MKADKEPLEMKSEPKTWFTPKYTVFNSSVC